jgi:hypothetical protein
LAVLCSAIFRIFAQADLYSPNDRCHVVLPLALASRAPANQALVNLNRMLAPNAVALWPDHASPEFVENLEGGFITRKPELALELERGLAWGLGCH